MRRLNQSLLASEARTRNEGSAGGKRRKISSRSSSGKDGAASGGVVVGMEARVSGGGEFDEANKCGRGCKGLSNIWGQSGSKRGLLSLLACR